MKRRYKEQTLGEAIREMLKKYKDIPSESTKDPVVECFKSLFGKTVVDSISEIKTFNKVLYVAFNDYEIRYEIRKGKKQIINTINKELEAEVIRDIQFL